MKDLESELRDLLAHPPPMPAALRRSWVDGVPANALGPKLAAYEHVTRDWLRKLRKIRKQLRALDPPVVAKPIKSAEPRPRSW